MIGIVVITHGSLSEQLLATASLIMGAPENVHAVTFTSRDSLDDLRKNAGKAIEQLTPVVEKIRDDQGYWQQVEEYVSAHTRAEFSHGLCPECMARLYPGIDVAGGVEMGASPGEE